MNCNAISNGMPPLIEMKMLKYTSRVAPGALAQCLQHLTSCLIQNARRGLEVLDQIQLSVQVKTLDAVKYQNLSNQ